MSGVIEEEPGQCEDPGVLSIFWISCFVYCKYPPPCLRSVAFSLGFSPLSLRLLCLAMIPQTPYDLCTTVPVQADTRHWSLAFLHLKLLIAG